VIWRRLRERTRSGADRREPKTTRHAAVAGSAFVSWALHGELDRFYAGVRWDGWRTLTSQLTAGQGVSAYPFPWSKEGKGEGVDRRPAPLLEVYGVLLSTVAQITGWGSGDDHGEPA
jgi:hypothetical protein